MPKPTPLSVRARLLFCLAVATPVFAQSEDAEAPANEAPAKSEPAAEAAPDEAPAPRPKRPRKAAPAETSAADEKPEPEHAASTAPRITPLDSTPAKDQAMRTAKLFFAALLEADARGAMEHAAVPFQLEDRRFQSGPEVFQEFLKDLRKKRTDLLTLYGIELFTAAEMEKKYGKPPARLAQFPYKDGKSFIAVANLSGHAAVALLKQTDRGFKVVGYHD